MIKYQEKLFDYEFPNVYVTTETLKDIKKNPSRYANCDVRVRMGLIYTDESKERYINDSLKRTLPGSKTKTLRFGKRN